MADRRMFAKSVVQSSRFLKMPVSSRELYFQMGVLADDDGVVEAWNVMKLTNAREDDLRVLVSKGYVQILDNEDMIAYLTDWEINNQIRKDRYHPGAYKTLKLQILEGLNVIDNQVTTNRQPSDNQMSTEVRLGKDSLVKDSVEPKRKRFVPPTLEEVKAYCQERKNNVDPNRFFDYYQQGQWKDSKGNPVKNWKQKLITWENKQPKAEPKKWKGVENKIDFEELKRRCVVN